MSAYPRAGNLAAYQTVATHGGVAASDPHGLIVMLLDGALERIAAARGFMANGMQAEKGRLIGRAVAIVDELRISLDGARGGELARNLEALYDYIGRQLMRANAENRVGSYGASLSAVGGFYRLDDGSGIYNFHTGGCNLVFADGHTAFLKNASFILNITTNRPQAETYYKWK